MFDSRKTFTTHVADAADLLIDFATLGEYGLEPAQSAHRPCEGRQRGGLRSSGSWAAAVERFATQA